MQKAKLGLVRKKSRLGSARNRKGGCYQSVSEAVVMFTSCVHFTNFFAFVFFFRSDQLSTQRNRSNGSCDKDRDREESCKKCASITRQWVFSSLLIASKYRTNLVQYLHSLLPNEMAYHNHDKLLMQKSRSIPFSLHC